jgi:hypothetical protein
MKLIFLPYQIIFPYLNQTEINICYFFIFSLKIIKKKKLKLFEYHLIDFNSCKLN